jgi:hypothetical protein
VANAPTRRVGSSIAAALAVATVLAACESSAATNSTSTGVAATSPTTTIVSTTGSHDDDVDHAANATITGADRITAQLATAAFQDLTTAEASGWSSTLDTLGCFQDAALGGMGVHYVNQTLMDATVDIGKPEGLVYEMNAGAHITGLVAHEYIVPVEAWTNSTPPKLFGQTFHRHPTLPLWVLHAWLWKDNAAGVFSDWNPAVRQCPTDVPIFGVDLPK